VNALRPFGLLLLKITPPSGVSQTGASGFYLLLKGHRDNRSGPYMNLMACAELPKCSFSKNTPLKASFFHLARA
jgi:hypothetical protein